MFTIEEKALPDGEWRFYYNSPDTVRDTFGLGRFIGSGAFAMVFEHPTHLDRVVKVVNTLRDTGYGGYIKQLSKEKKQNPHLPIIYSATSYNGMGYTNSEKKVPIKMLFVEMERLHSIKSSFEYEEYRKLKDFLKVSPIGFKFWIRLFRHTKDERRVHGFIRKTRESIRGFTGLDLHDGNIMVRYASGKPVLVLTDPLV